MTNTAFTLSITHIAITIFNNKDTGQTVETQFGLSAYFQKIIV